MLGLTRSLGGAKALGMAGAEVFRGSLEDIESLRSGAAAADAVIHTAFVHDFSNFSENCAIDKRAIETLGAALEGSDRALLVTSALGMMAEGRMPTEEDAALPPSATMPRASEAVAEEMFKRGVRVSTVRLPQVHDTVKQGLVTYLIALAREKGVSAYVGDGTKRWAAVHVVDAARVYRLALEKPEAGIRYHAVAEEGMRVRDIAEAIGRSLKVPVVSKSPEEAAAHFGFLAGFVGRDITGSSVQTQKRLGWRPTGPGLLADLEQMRYSEDPVSAASVVSASA